MSTSCTKERFLRNVRDHRLTISLDQGLHRHITLSRPGCSLYRFHIVTWPGYLSISGDAGSYTFCRLSDMFDFFRDASGQNRINEDYWAEKLQAVDRNCGQRQLDVEAYTGAIRTDLSDHLQNSNLSLSQAKRVVEAVRDAGLFEPVDDVNEAVRSAMEFCCPETDVFLFNEFWDHRLTQNSFRLVWCMRAISWGIKQYDLHKSGRSQAAVDQRVLRGLAA